MKSWPFSQKGGGGLLLRAADGRVEEGYRVLGRNRGEATVLTLILPLRAHPMLQGEAELIADKVGGDADQQ